MSGKIKAVIFDMDGVIFDSERLSKELYPIICKSYGYNVSSDMIDMTLGLTYEGTAKFFKTIINNEFPYEDTAIKLQSMLIDYAKLKKLPLKPNVVETLIALKNKKILTAIASSNNKISVMSYIDSYNLNQYFDVIVTGDDVSKGKPSPEIFIKTSKLLNTEPNKCLVVEDSKNGLIAARKAGMISIMVPDLLPFTEDLSTNVDCCFNNIMEILNIV